MWLVPALAMSLLSVRALKKLGWRAPDFDALVLRPLRWRRPLVPDRGCRLLLYARVARRRRAQPRRRAAIPLPAAASAEIIQASFVHLAEATLSSIVTTTDGMPSPSR